MSADKNKTIFTYWVLANFVGWFLGVIVILMLAAIAESIHVGNAVYLGLGMGWSIGFMQWLVGRKWFGATRQWMWASTISIALPFLFADLMGTRWNGSYLLPTLAAVGGLLAGGWQARSLPLHGATRNWWIAASGLAWASAAALPQFIAVPGHPRTPTEAVRNIAAIMLGGLALGIVTGYALVWLLESSSQRSDPTITWTS